MNSLSFYVENTNASPRNMEIYKGLNNIVEKGELKDVALFYNNVDFLPIQPKFAVFNSHDIWHFTGTVVATSMSNLFRLKNTVNKFQVLYLYDKSQKNLLNLLSTAGDRVITLSQEDKDEYYRLTGEMPDLVEKIEDIVNYGSF